MSTVSESFREQFSHSQKQFNEWKPFEQLYAIIELTRTFQLSYRYFLLQFFQNQIKSEAKLNEYFEHTSYEANTPDIVACRRSVPFEKILESLQLFFPLISNETFSEELFQAYRDILIYVDSKLISSNCSTCSHQQLLSSCQEIFFFLQTNPKLRSIVDDLPRLIYFLQTKNFLPSDQGRFPNHKSLQRHSSARIFSTSSAVPLMNCSSDGIYSSPIYPSMKHRDVTDSGVDLTDGGTMNSLIGRTTIHTNKSSTVKENLSSDQKMKHTPLAAALSAPMPSSHPDYRYKNSPNGSMRLKTTLTKSDEEEHEYEDAVTQDSPNRNSREMINHSKGRTFHQYYSYQHRQNRLIGNNYDVSPYLDVDRSSIPVRNTFTQPNSGMKDVPKWLKHLRLHKYDDCFSQMTYDEMMNLTKEKLKEQKITDGACSKILVNIKKLKERSLMLQKTVEEFEQGQINISVLVQHINELMITPIRAKQRRDVIEDPDEDLPNQIIEALGTAYRKVTSTTPSDVGNTLIGLFNRCYQHEAFTVEQRHLILQWRGKLTNILQQQGKLDMKTIQSTFSYGLIPRRSAKPLTTSKSSSATYLTNNSSISTPVSKFSSEPQDSHLSSTNRGTTKSPISNSEDSNENNKTNVFTTPPRHSGDYLANHQHQALTRKSSIHPYGESSTKKDELKQTFSEPNHVRYMKSFPIASTNTYHVVTSPYTQQQIVSHSPLRRTFPSNSPTDQHENLDEQKHNNADFDSFYHQITESALSDDVADSSFAQRETDSAEIQQW